MWLRLIWNCSFSCRGLPGAGITGVHCHARPSPIFLSPVVSVHAVSGTGLTDSYRRDKRGGGGERSRERCHSSFQRRVEAITLIEMVTSSTCVGVCPRVCRAEHPASKGVLIYHSLSYSHVSPCEKQDSCYILTNSSG